VLSLTYDLAHRLAGDTEELEEEIFPPLLSRMRDNVLVFTEDHISPDLAELSHYLQGYLRIDGADLRVRFAKLVEWLQERLTVDPCAPSPATCYGCRHADARDLLRHRGFVEYLAGLPVDPRMLLSPPRCGCGRRCWSLKEFELFHGVRRLVVSVEDQEGVLMLADRGLNRTGWAARRWWRCRAPPGRRLHGAWVVDPQIRTTGHHDITGFAHRVAAAASEHRGAGPFVPADVRWRRVHRLAASRA
jgi:hypothetical protein